MKHARLFGVLAFALLAQAFAQSPPAPPPPKADPAATSYGLPRLESLPRAEVVRTVDGDTIELLIGGKAERCRLAGVDTPELHGERNTFYGREAAWFTFNLLAGESVWYESDPKLSRDTYGRLLVYVYRVPDGLFVNLELLRQGYARLYEYDHPRAALFKTYEARARKALKGVWNPNLARQADDAPPFAPQPAATATPKAAVATPAAPAAAGGDTIVYATKSGKKYHTAGCRSLSKSAIPITLSAAKARGLQPCSVCKPPR